MYDLHAHILPGADDGPREMEESLQMLKIAVADGIKGIAMTPHVIPGRHDNLKEKVIKLTAELQARAEDLEIELYPASEISLSEETLAGLKSGSYCTINGSRYVLVELPPLFDSEKIYEAMHSHAGDGSCPAHRAPGEEPEGA